MRRLSNDRLAPSAPVVREMAGRTVWTCTFRFITPVFGGGVQVDGHKKPFDPVTPVRVPSIRGQLRFWWRAVNPRRCTTPEELACAEAIVFGEAAKGNGVRSAEFSIRVLRQPGEAKKIRPLVDGAAFGFADGMQAIAYGAFPLRDQAAPFHHGTLHQYDADWQIEMSFSNVVANDVAAAMWAWSQFGGLGGRSRRGFGAIQSLHNTVEVPSVQDGWNHWGLNNAPAVFWPHIAGGIGQQTACSPQAHHSGQAAHKELLEWLRKFRQGVHLGRNPGAGHPGRSRWPEPDEIRRITRTAAHLHQPVHPVGKFPRAAFGTPIIFHFMGNGEPADSTLNPEGRGRFASPLILRPAYENGQYVARALRLRGTMPAAFRLVRGQNNLRTGLSASVTASEAAQIAPLAAEIDPISRYFQLLQDG